jgi:hypothetical protein
VERLLYTRAEAAVSLGMSLRSFEEKVQPFVSSVLSGQLILIPPAELERWVRERLRGPVLP